MIEYETMIRHAEHLSSDLRKGITGKSKGRSKASKEKDQDDDEDEDLDSAPTYARASERKQPESERHFLRQFGQSERELADANSEEGGIPQVLMLMNGNEHKLLSKSNSYVMVRAEKAPSETEKVNFLYLSFLSRNATAEEQRFIKSERIGLNQLVWILMNTREFMFVQ
jgi:hypothetical protein